MRAELWPETCFCPYGALVERADRDRRVDRVAPNESSVAQLRAELWPETCFCPYGALVERADRDRRVDRDAPNESSVAQLRAELWPETCVGPEVFFIILPPFINHDRGLFSYKVSSR